MRGDAGEEEGLTWPCRKVQAAGSSGSEGLSKSEALPCLERNKSHYLRVTGEAKHHACDWHSIWSRSQGFLAACVGY
jgi:hypothetical protein